MTLRLRFPADIHKSHELDVRVGVNRGDSSPISTAICRLFRPCKPFPSFPRSAWECVRLQVCLVREV